jgi:hypothetical protein
VIREAAAALGPLELAVEAMAPPLEAPFMTGLVAARCRLVMVALGPLVAPRSYFLEFLVDISAWSFNTLCLPEVIRGSSLPQALRWVRWRWWIRAGQP